MANKRQLAKNSWYDWSINHIPKSMEKPSRHTTSFQCLQDVYTTSLTSYRRLVDVETTSRVYWKVMLEKRSRASLKQEK